MPFLGGRGQASRGYFGGGATSDAPTSVVSTKGNGQISVAFSAPVFNGGLVITTYQYALSTDSYATWTTRSAGTTASPLVITGLTNGTSYGVKLRAVNALGSGTASDAATAVIPSTVPGTPTNVQGTANGVTSSTVTWTAPAAANTGPNFTDITGYKVEYALSPYSSYTVFTADTGNANTSISVTGLTNGGSYKFKVTAKNSNGFGTTSTPSDVVVTNIVPGAPTIGTMTLSTTNTTDSLAWTAPTANGGSAITGYVYQTTTNDGSTFAGPVATGSTATSKTFDPGYTTTVTKVKVAAVNSLGTGPYSEISAVGYGGWSNPSYTITDATDCPNCGACTCPACDGGCDSCGSRSVTGSKSITGTKGYKSKTCYKWTRGAQENAGPFDAGTTSACTAAYGSCSAGDCGCSAGDCGCSDCSGSWTNTTYTSSFVVGGVTYTKFQATNSAGNGTGTYYYYIDAANDIAYLCGCYEHRAYNAQYCYVEDKYRVIDTGGCQYYRSTSSCGGGGKG
jgi:hypothetical protein